MCFPSAIMNMLNKDIIIKSSDMSVECGMRFYKRMCIQRYVQKQIEENKNNDQYLIFFVTWYVHYYVGCKSI